MASTNEEEIQQIIRHSPFKILCEIVDELKESKIKIRIDKREYFVLKCEGAKKELLARCIWDFTNEIYEHAPKLDTKTLLRRFRFCLGEPYQSTFDLAAAQIKRTATANDYDTMSGDDFAEEDEDDDAYETRKVKWEFKRVITAMLSSVYAEDEYQRFRNYLDVIKKPRSMTHMDIVGRLRTLNNYIVDLPSDNGKAVKLSEADIKALLLKMTSSEVRAKFVASSLNKATTGTERMAQYLDDQAPPPTKRSADNTKTKGRKRYQDNKRNGGSNKKHKDASHDADFKPCPEHGPKSKHSWDACALNPESKNYKNPKFMSNKRNQAASQQQQYAAQADRDMYRHQHYQHQHPDHRDGYYHQRPVTPPNYGPPGQLNQYFHNGPPPSRSTYYGGPPPPNDHPSWYRH